MAWSSWKKGCTRLPNVLIVDDDRDLLHGQKAYLEEKGFVVETAENMKEGLARLDSFRPDIIVVDLMMEHYDTGFVFSKKVREKPGLADVPVLMQTAASKEVGFTFDAADPKARRWMKVDEVLIKPVPLDALEGRIRNALLRRGAGAPEKSGAWDGACGGDAAQAQEDTEA